MAAPSMGRVALIRLPAAFMKTRVFQPPVINQASRAQLRIVVMSFDMIFLLRDNITMVNLNRSINSKL